MKKISLLLAILFLLIINVNASVQGDIDGNGIVEVSDYIILRRYFIKTRDLNSDEMKRADVNADGKINPTDYNTIMRILLNFDSPSTDSATINSSNKTRIHFISGDVSRNYNGEITYKADGKTKEPHDSDAILLESNGKYAMIDMSTRYNYNNYVKKYLEALGVKELEFVIITHLHRDHVGGLKEYISDIEKKNEMNFTIKNVYFKKNCSIIDNDGKESDVTTSCRSNINSLIKSIKKVNDKNGTNIKIINPDENGNEEYTIKFGQMTIDLYNLQKVAKALNCTNENVISIVSLINIRGINNEIYRVLSYGDSCSATVNKKYANMLTNNGKNKIDVLKMEHHGLTPMQKDFTDVSVANHMVITGTCRTLISNSVHTSIKMYSLSAKEKNINVQFYFVGNAMENDMKDKYNDYDYWRAGIVFDFSNNITVNDVHFDNQNEVVMTKPRSLATSDAIKVKDYTKTIDAFNTLCK